MPNQLSTPHKVKGFADGSTVISSSTEDHQRALHDLALFCTDLVLTLKPPKCVSFVNDGRQVDKKTTFYLEDRKTRNIVSGPTRFLGQTLCRMPLSTVPKAIKRLSSEYSRQLNNLDQSPIRGEFKLWIYRRFMVSCFHYHLAVDTIPTSTLKKMQANAMRKIKKWLGLTRSTTTAIIHHLDVIDIPSISELHTKAKLTFLSAISVSQDPMITELETLLSDDSYLRSQGIPSTAVLLLQKARNSVSSVGKRQMTNQCRKVYREHRVETWNNKLNQLTVQRKFLAITELEAKNKVWGCIQAGIPAGQLSFLVRAGSDTLPTPLNLKRWRMRVDPRCPLCNHHHPTVQHILSACPTALQQGRYTWRHDSALRALVDGIKSGLPEARVLADLPGLRAEENPPSTIPNEILVTTARPDIVAITNREITLVELTIPYNSPECLANTKHRKETKTNYHLALSDLDSRGYSASLITIEIGALGHWLPTTKASLQQLLPGVAK